MYNIFNTIQWLASLEVYGLVLGEGAVSRCDPGCQTVVETNKQKTDNQIKVCMLSLNILRTRCKKLHFVLKNIWQLTQVNRCNSLHSRDAGLKSSSSKCAKENYLNVEMDWGFAFLLGSFLPYLYIQFWFWFKKKIWT